MASISNHHRVGVSNCMTGSCAMKFHSWNILKSWETAGFYIYPSQLPLSLSWEGAWLDLEGTEFSGTFTSETEQGFKAINRSCVFYSGEKCIGIHLVQPQISDLDHFLFTTSI